MTAQASRVTWRTTQPTMTWEEAARSLPCGFCGQPADCLHLFQGDHFEVSCPDHDAGGYWVPFDRIFGRHRYPQDDSIEGWTEHFHGGIKEQPWLAFLGKVDALRWVPSK